MKSIRLERFAHLPECTFGRLLLGNGAQLYTIERPWQNNESFVSCIPDGSYELEWDTTGRIKDVPRLRETGPRTQINIHSANYAHQLHGCIAPGLSYDLSKLMVSSSKDAMALLIEYLQVPEVAQDSWPLDAVIEISSVQCLVK